ncbi:MAG: hypothetical protein K6G34_05770 [Lachnospiraceae bacterium]|nr:hypothetical protein [Lachnospiraceae bacterium]
MKKAIIFLLSALILAGCGSKNEVPSDTGTEISSENDSEAEENNADNEILTIWRKDVTLQDTFIPTQELVDLPFKELTTPASDAVPVIIGLGSREEISDKIDSGKGGVSAVHAVVELAQDLKEQFPKIWAAMKNFNEFAEQNSALEITDGETRYNAFRMRKDAPSFLHLNSWTGIEITRADSGILSFFRTAYRYNRDIEPDYHEIYGMTIDSVSGRILSLNDIFIDTERLPQMIWEALVRSGWKDETDPGREEFIDILTTAVQGCREDGSFAWAIDPLGIEFGLNEASSQDGKELHRRERAYIPFSMCEEILRPGISGAAYDHMVHLTAGDVKGVTGYSIPSPEPVDFYSAYYIVQKSGGRYLYCTSDNHSDLYRIGEEGLEKTGEVDAEISYEHFDHMSIPLSPDSYKLYKSADLLQELFLEADAHSDDDGMVVRDGYYELKTNPMPITTGSAFEAEIFEDSDSTESAAGTVPEHSILTIVRSDGESFIDCKTEDGEQIIRLYVEKDDSEGLIVNGHPADEVIAQQGWMEE